MSSRSGITKCAVHSYFILLLIAIAAGAALIIVMAVLGFVGFGSSQVTIVTCTGYFQTKYGNFANFATISFLSTIIGTTILTVLMVLMLCWVI